MEAGLGGYTFYLDLNNNSALDAGEPSAVSAADGSFTITGVTPGTYTLRETGGNPAFTCTFPAGCQYQITVTSHAQITGKDFGNAPPKVVDFGNATDHRAGRLPVDAPTRSRSAARTSPRS